MVLCLPSRRMAATPSRSCPARRCSTTTSGPVAEAAALTSNAQAPSALLAADGPGQLQLGHRRSTFDAEIPRPNIELGLALVCP